MTSSRAIKLLFGGLLGLSLAGKLAASESVPFPHPEAAAVASESMLRSAGFRTDIMRTQRSPQVFTVARRGACRLLAGEYPVHGTFADVYRDLARAFGSLHYAYRGEVHETQPKLTSLIDFFMWRELQRIGVEARRAPVIAVASTPACKVETLPWQSVARLPA